MKKMLKAFTLVELIVVIAIIAILSTVGFVSYTGYIRDSRNSVRESTLAEASNVVTQFIATQGRAPACETASPCDFAPTGATATVVNGIKVLDWNKMNVRSIPTDPKKKADDSVIYYSYGTDNVDYDLAATKEEASGFTAIVKGSKENGGMITSAITSDPVPTGKKTCAAAPDGTDGKVINGEACIPYKF